MDDICSGTSTPFSRYSNIPSYRNENINDQLDEAIYMNEFSEEYDMTKMNLTLSDKEIQLYDKPIDDI